jgi:hypothetical protein
MSDARRSRGFLAAAVTLLCAAPLPVFGNSGERGLICVASFGPPVPKTPEGAPPGIEPPLPSGPLMSTSTWAPGAHSRFTFQVDGRPASTLERGETLAIRDLPTDRRVPVRVLLDDRPFESFRLDLGRARDRRICLWLYPGYWHWIDNGWSAELGCSCAPVPVEPDLTPRAWHHSPSADPRSSTAYARVDWARVERLQPGMSRARAEEHLGRPFETYHHPENAILYSTTPAGTAVEVAVRLAPDGSVVELSFLDELRGAPVR